MNQAQFDSFDSFRRSLKEYCNSLNSRFGEELCVLQKKAAFKDTPPYPIETPVVYNRALDEINEDSVITKIVIGDNPGKNEQLAVNQKYLVGQAGKIASGFFAKNKEFKTDFRSNVIILNKTPVHSAKTAHLKQILKEASPELCAAVKESLVFMAGKTAELHIKLCSAASEKDTAPELWLTGYAELKKGSIFEEYARLLKNAYTADGSLKSDTKKEHEDAFPKFLPYWEKVFVFQHFSMNRFSIDLADFIKKQGEGDVVQAARLLGTKHKNEILG